VVIFYTLQCEKPTLKAQEIRRQKRRRSRRAKALMLADKSHHAANKDARRLVTGD
jgi:hypothetical protein